MAPMFWSGFSFSLPVNHQAQQRGEHLRIQARVGPPTACLHARASISNAGVTIRPAGSPGQFPWPGHCRLPCTIINTHLHGPPGPPGAFRTLGSPLLQSFSHAQPWAWAQMQTCRLRDLAAGAACCWFRGSYPGSVCSSLLLSDRERKKGSRKAGGWGGGGRSLVSTECSARLPWREAAAAPGNAPLSLLEDSPH